MNHLIIGTAGHVDHGKTCLIKALTGIDTDRLAEEKKRGITIELGFASLVLDDGRRAGIVDVPGHEKFIKNMLAGAGGIDLALLVVAADEGFMPQTREHLSILTLLGVTHGVVALTKTDLVDADWLAMVQDDVRAELAGSFLEHAPLVCVSAVTGQGLPELRAELTRQAAAIADKDAGGPFRLPVDRVFSVDGFGTVVTGTLVEGRVRVGDTARLYPGPDEAKVRNLQVHGEDVPEAFAGQRVAMNLAGVKKERVERGQTAAAPGSLALTQTLDVWLDIVKECRHDIADGLRLHLYHGARTVLCRLALVGQQRCAAGCSAPARLYLDEPLACREGDRFVVRFYSPLETVGGGMILNCAPAHRRRRDETAAAALRTLALGGEAERLALVLREDSLLCPDAAHLAVRARLGTARTLALLRQCPEAVALGGESAARAETGGAAKKDAKVTAAKAGENTKTAARTETGGDAAAGNSVRTETAGDAAKKAGTDTKNTAGCSGTDAKREGAAQAEGTAQAEGAARAKGAAQAEGMARAEMGGAAADQAGADTENGAQAANGTAWLHTEALAELAARAAALLEAYHAANPLVPGMPRDELRAKLLPAGCPRPDEVLDAMLAHTGEVAAAGAVVKRAGFGVYYTQAQQKLRDALCAAYAAGGFAPPETPEVQQRFGADREALRQMLRALCGEGELVLVCPQFYMSGACVAAAQQTLTALQAKNGTIALGEFRDALGTSRKFALPLLEYFDRRGVTVKNGDLRTLKPQS